MTQTRTARPMGTPKAPSPRPTRTSLLGTALLLAPTLVSSPQHVAEGDGARVTALWRSERGLDRYAKAGLKVASAVLEGMGERAADAPLVTVGIAESSTELRYLEDPSAKKKDQAARRKLKRARRKALEAQGSVATGEVVEMPDEPVGSTENLWVVPGLLKENPDESTVGGAVVAMLPNCLLYTSDAADE